jgi:Lrp/AsnC family leucine-responsive transcriptional regulator
MDLSAEERRILRQLQLNARITNNDLARAVGMSDSACHRKTKLLHESGVITGYRALIAPEVVGYGLTAYILVNLDQRIETDARLFFDAVRAEPRIIECTAITGSHDLIIKAVARDIDDLADLTMNKVLKWPSVKDVNSSIMLKKIKDDAGIPV